MVHDKRDNYPNEVQHFYYETLKWCGCGEPHFALQFMRDVLAVMNMDFTNSRFRRVGELLPDNSPLSLSYLYMLDALGLTEHGGSIFGCWLTPKGKDALLLLSNCDLKREMSDE